MICAHHRVRDHVGELAIELWAPDLAELYREAARALAEIVGGTAPLTADPATPPRSVWMTARDRDALLVDWLNEIIFLSELGGMLYPDIRVLFADGHRLHAEIRGRRIDHPAISVKAATFHGLHVHEDHGGIGATVVLDI